MNKDIVNFGFKPKGKAQKGVVPTMEQVGEAYEAPTIVPHILYTNPLSGMMLRVLSELVTRYNQDPFTLEETEIQALRPFEVRDVVGKLQVASLVEGVNDGVHHHVTGEGVNLIIALRRIRLLQMAAHVQKQENEIRDPRMVQIDCGRLGYLEFNLIPIEKLAENPKERLEHYGTNPVCFYATKTHVSRIKVNLGKLSEGVWDKRFTHVCIVDEEDAGW